MRIELCESVRRVRISEPTAKELIPKCIDLKEVCPNPFVRGNE